MSQTRALMAVVHDRPDPEEAHARFFAAPKRLRETEISLNNQHQPQFT